MSSWVQALLYVTQAGTVLAILGVAIEIAVDGDGRDAEISARTDDPHGDLASVCDQDLLEHGPYGYRNG